jgi:predicted nucleic acid-binding protein
MKIRITRDSSLREVLLYLDTNIFLDLTRKRKPDSITLFENIKKGKYKAATSTFTLLEFMEDEQERLFAEREILGRKKSFDEVRRHMDVRDLTAVELEIIKVIVNEDIFKPYINTEIIELTYLTSEGWNRAYELQQKLNISSDDAIHLAMADIWGCDVFVTGDDQLRQIGSAFFEPSVMVFSTSSEIESKIETLRKEREPKEKTLEKKTLIERKAHKKLES